MRKHDISCHYHLRDSNWLKGTDYVAFTDKENNELKKLVKDLEEENSRQDKVIRKMKEQLIQLMVENAELKRRN